MAKDITLLGATLRDVPALDIPQAGGGTARFYDCIGTKSITENGEADVKGLEKVIVNVAGGGGGLPSGIAALDYGDVVVTTDFTTSRRTFAHKLGVAPDMVIVWAVGNIATTYSMLFALRSTQMAYRSSTYSSYMGYHGNSTTTVSLTNSNSASYGVSNMTATTFQLASSNSSYYWRAGTYKYLAIKFS